MQTSQRKTSHIQQLHILRHTSVYLHLAICNPLPLINMQICTECDKHIFSSPNDRPVPMIIRLHGNRLLPQRLLCCDIDGSCVTDEQLCGEEPWVFTRGARTTSLPRSTDCRWYRIHSMWRALGGLSWLLAFHGSLVSGDKLTTLFKILHGNCAVHENVELVPMAERWAQKKNTNFVVDCNGLYPLLVPVTAADEGCTSLTFGMPFKSNCHRTTTTLFRTTFLPHSNPSNIGWIKVSTAQITGPCTRTNPNDHMGTSDLIGQKVVHA